MHVLGVAFIVLHMPIIAAPIELPPDVIELRSADVDADGSPELLAIARTKGNGSPDAMTLTVFHLDERGAVQRSWSAPLHNQPLIIDVESGIWAMGAKGLVEITEAGTAAVVQADTPLRDLGKTTPVFGDVFVDLEDDGLPEAVIVSGNRLQIVDTNGLQRAAISVPSRGALEVRTRGGVKLTSSAVSPTWNIDDFDGDGIKDLLLPRNDQLVVHRMTTDGLNGKTTVPLPIDIARKEREGARKEGETEKRVVSVWLEDIDGDGKTDFAAQLWVTEGSWMGAEGEILFAKGTGDGFAKPQRMPSDNAVLLVRLIDLNGDGAKAFATAEIDFSVGNLTRAMLTQKIKVDVYYRAWTSERFADAARLHSVVVPVGNDRDPPVELQQDVSGDGIPDLVTAAAGKSVEVYQGTGKGFGKTPLASRAMEFQTGEDLLWVGNIMGDDRSEIVIWQRREQAAQVLYLSDEIASE